MLQDAPGSTSKEPGADVADIEQAGAICLRRSKKGAVEILLVGSRRNGRWGLPKGHIEDSETSSAAAGREAFEEAGIRGAVAEKPFGRFTYFKDSNPRRYRVTAHLLDVSSVAKSFPEKATRKTQWFPLDVAVKEASQPGLRSLLLLLR
jgi:8-oxo-dGTP pyrophosphatase MutT (NUDIX family)